MLPFSGEHGQIIPGTSHSCEGNRVHARLRSPKANTPQEEESYFSVWTARPFKHTEMLCKHGAQKKQCQTWHFPRRQNKMVRTWNITWWLKGVAPHYCFRVVGFQRHCGEGGCSAQARNEATMKGEPNDVGKQHSQWARRTEARAASREY